MTLSPIDLILIAAYIGSLFILGYRFKKKQSDENFLLAARKLSLPAFVMTLVTTWYGAILGVGEFVFGFGMVGWVTNGLFWYIVYIGFAYLLSKRIHDSGHTTVADHLKDRIGKKSAGIGSILTYIMTTPAPYILSLGVVLNMLFGWSLWASIGAASVVSGLYIWWGGFRAVVRTDILQFVLMYLCFGALLFFAIKTFGGWNFLTENLQSSHLTWKGELPLSSIFVWGFLALWTLVDPNFYARCYAAKDGKTAQKGVLWGILFWFVFDMLSLFTALYARAGFPDADPLFSYLVLADGVLPIFLKGLFVVTVLSIIMSTIDSFLFSSSTILAVDWFKKKWNASLITLTRFGIILTLILSVVFIAIFESIIGIIYAIGTVGVSALAIPMLLAVLTKRKLSDNAITWSMILAGIGSGAWMVHGWLHVEYGWPVYLWGLEPMYVGLLVSGVVIVLSRTFLKRL